MLAFFYRHNTIPQLLGIWLVYLACVAAGLMHHEMWRDEYNVYNIIKHAQNVSFIVEHIRYEGHPIIWFLVVWWWHQILPIGPDILKVACFFNAAIGSAILLRYSPFSVLEKCLILSSFFFLYEYSVVARSYSFYLIYLPLWCAIYDRYHTSFSMTYLLALVLVAGLTAFVALTSATLVFSFCMILLLLPKHRKRHLTACGIIGLIYVGMVAWIYPPNDFVHYNGELHYNFSTYILSVISIFGSFFPIIDPLQPDWFSVNRSLTGVVALVLLYRLLRNHPKAIMVFATGLIVLFALLTYTQIYLIRFAGLSWMLLIGILWVYYPFHMMDQNRRKLFLIFLAGNAVGGLMMWAVDIAKPFSSSTATIPILKDHYQGDYIFLAQPDYLGPVFIAYSKHINSQLLASGNFNDHMILNTKRMDEIYRYKEDPKQVLAEEIATLSHEARKRCTHALVVMRSTLENPDYYKLKHIADFQKPVITDEKYSVYEVEGIPPAPCNAGLQ